MEGVIINKARELFFSYGLKSVSMDDLARSAGISKKTIYQSVTDKNELVQKVVESFSACHAQQVQECSNESANAVDELFRQAELPFETLSDASPGFFYELEKFFPQAWDRMTAHKDEFIIPAIVRNLKRGIEEGLYRADLDLKTVADIRYQQITTALNPAGFGNGRKSSRLLMHELTVFFLHAIVNTKGKRTLSTYLNKKNENRQN